MAHYQPNVCQVPAAVCQGKKISLGGAFSLSLAGASASGEMNEEPDYQTADVLLQRDTDLWVKIFIFIKHFFLHKKDQFCGCKISNNNLKKKFLVIFLSFVRHKLVLVYLTWLKLFWASGADRLFLFMKLLRLQIAFTNRVSKLQPPPKPLRECTSHLF